MPDTTDAADIDTGIHSAEPASSERSSRLQTARDTAKDAAQRAGEAIADNPLAVVAGGIAIGVAAGALLPKTRRETELLGSVGRRLTDAAADAADAAKEAARGELSTLPLSREAARDQVGKVIDQVAKAITGAGEAALASRRPAPASSTDDSQPSAKNTARRKPE